ncbi:MAG: CaiB/BaiF CoA transferase family protein [Alphaproteobacteria bacterium]
MQPFEGVKVIDMTHVLAGPFCAYQLAVMGADVIKVEAPDERDMSRDSGGAVAALNRRHMGLGFMAQASNKRALTLNLKNEKGRLILKRLAAISDVLIENYRTGALARLGLGYGDLAKLNPRLIYCSMTGYGQNGPKAGHAAYDNVIQAISGLMDVNVLDGMEPLKVGPPVLDYGSGIMAAFAIASALYQRSRTDRGQHIDVSMFDSALLLMSSTVVDFLNGGGPTQRMGNDSAYSGYASYPTKDGLLMIGAWTPKQHARMWRALGRPDLANGTGYEEMEARKEQESSVLRQILKARTADEWETLLNAAGVPAERVRTLEDALAHPQLKHRSVLHTHKDVPGAGGPLTVPVAAFGYAHGGPAVRTPPPRHGAHTDEVLAELGFDGEAIAGLRREGVV